jgi:tripartite ATP-independent transporter DctP family solute receptor
MLRIKSLIVLIASFAVATAEAREFISSDVYPADFPTVQAVAHMNKLLRERTGGRHSISVLGQEDRDSENFTVGQVRNGTLDMARVNLAVLNHIVPSTAVLSLPYLFKSTAQIRSVLDGPIGDDILADMESSGIIGLCFYDMGVRSYTAKKPIRTAADMRGQKVRIQQSDISAAVVRAMGAVPTPVPNDRVYRALQMGVVDVVENTLPSYSSLRHHEVAPFYSLTEHSMAPSVLIFSKRAWDELSVDDRAAIRAAAKESATHLRQRWKEYETLSRMTTMAAGAQIVTDIDKQSFVNVLRPLYPTFVSDSRLQNMVKRIQAE